MRHLHDRRHFARQMTLALGWLAWPGRDAGARTADALTIVLLRPTGADALAADAADGFAMGLDEVIRAASLLGRTLSGVTVEASPAGLTRLRTLRKTGVQMALVTTASGQHARQAAAIVADAGGLVLCGHDRLVEMAGSWMPPDDAVVDLVGRWAADEGRRAWHVLTTPSERDSAVLALVRRAAAEHGGRIVGEQVLSPAGNRGDSPDSVPPDADLLVVASAAPSMDPAWDPAPDGSLPVAFCAVAATPARDPARRMLLPETWHGSLRRYGATQLNMRFRTGFGRPMTSTSWGHWLAVKAAWEVAVRYPDAGRAGHGMTQREALTRLVLDGQKGMGLRFERGGRLPQPLYLVERRVDADGQDTSVVVATRELPRGSAAGARDHVGMRDGRPLGGAAHLRQ
jgi:hypothetical protein